MPIRTKPDGSNEYVISLSWQYESIVDEVDYEYLKQWQWNYKVSESRYARNVYARRGGGTQRFIRGSRPTVLMHAVICERAHGPPPSAWHTPHHKNNDTLDNRRENLEWASKSEQRRKQKRRVARSPQTNLQDTSTKDDPIPF